MPFWSKSFYQNFNLILFCRNLNLRIFYSVHRKLVGLPSTGDEVKTWQRRRSSRSMSSNSTLNILCTDNTRAKLAEKRQYKYIISTWIRRERIMYKLVGHSQVHWFLYKIQDCNSKKFPFKENNKNLKNTNQLVSISCWFLPGWHIMTLFVKKLSSCKTNNVWTPVFVLQTNGQVDGWHFSMISFCKAPANFLK